MPRTRWLILSCLLAVAAYPLFIEGRWIETTITRIELTGLQRPLRLLHLSDLHLGHFPTLAELAAIARDAVAHQPDLICLTGDYVDNHYALQQPLEDVIRILAQAAPVYAVMGNHDGGVWMEGQAGDRSSAPVRRRLEQGGAIVLHNRWQRVKVREQELLLVGLGDRWSGEDDAVSAFRNAPAGLPTVVLVHNPDTKDRIADRPWHLMLAGHTHGNQVNLPFWEESWATVRDHRFISGHHHWNGRQLSISRGIGGIWGVRFRSRPEISILELVPRV
jgi:uncharacterized protein